MKSRTCADVIQPCRSNDILVVRKVGVILLTQTMDSIPCYNSDSFARGGMNVNSQARERRCNSDKLRRTEWNGGRFEAYFKQVSKWS